MIDLRSDTVTRPTPAMRGAMAEAEVGDAVLGDDPTVCALERPSPSASARRRRCYMPCGTMTNQVAIRATPSRGRGADRRRRPCVGVGAGRAGGALRRHHPPPAGAGRHLLRRRRARGDPPSLIRSCRPR